MSNTKAASKSVKVADPNSKNGAGFLWGVVALLLVAAVVIGYIVISGRGAKTEALAESAEDVSMEVSADGDVFTLKSASATADTPQVDLYEDFSCPHCAELEEATGDEMKNAIEAGDLVVNIRPLNFLDGQQDPASNEGHSTKAAAATAVLAEAGDANAYWNLRKYLFTNQQDVANTWQFEDFAEAAKAFGASDDEVSSIESAEISSGQTIAADNYDRLNDLTGSVSSPRILIDGKDYEGDLNTWVSEVTK